MMKKYLGVSMCLIAALVLFGLFRDYGKYWVALDIFIIAVNIAAGVMFFEEKMKVGVMLFVLPILLLIGFVFDYGKWWILINILLIIVNATNGIVFLQEKTK
jgi:hypothetical protein